LEYQYIICLPEEKGIRPYLHRSNTKLNILELKRLQRYINLAAIFFDLPSEELKNLAYTEDLEKLWIIARKTNADIGRLFIGNCLDSVEEFLDITDLNAIEQLGFDVLDSIAKRYLRLYKLVRHLFRKVKSKLSTEYKTPDELFEAILKSDKDGFFVNLIQENYVEYNPAKIEKLARNSDVYLLTDWKSFNKNKTLHPISNDSPTIEFLLLVQDSLIRDKKARMLARDYNSAVKYYWDCMAELMSYRNKDGKLMRDWTYKNGHIQYYTYGRS
jgi:hypothetical protein